MEEWIHDFGDFFSFHRPRAGAYFFLKYNKDIPSIPLVDEIRKTQSVLIVPGKHLGREGFLRIWIGAKPDYLKTGLSRIGTVLNEYI
jgi:aspartate/methionine/tyrosine aminotransferase